MSVTLTAKNALSVQQWANLMGQPVLEFNFIDITACGFDADMNHCSEFWTHWAYNAETFSHEQLAFFIQQAENKIENFLGYYVAPKWSYSEPHMFPNKSCVDLSQVKFRTNWKNVITGGVPKLTLLGNAEIVYSDEDGDGFSETATINYSDIDPDLPFEYPNRFKLFFVGYDADEHYEITDINSYTFDKEAGTLQIVVDSWVLINPLKYIPKGFARKTAFNPCADDIFVEGVEVYFEEVDTCKPNAEIVWSGDNVPCTDGGCVETVMPACIRWIDKCEGTFNIQPVTVDEDGCIENYISSYCSIDNYPDSIRINYLSGCYDRQSYKKPQLVGYEPCQQLVMAIAILAITYFGIQTCECHCIEDQINFYNEDLATGGPGLMSYRYPNEMLFTIFGNAKRGSLEAYNILESVKSNKGLCYKLY